MVKMATHQTDNYFVMMVMVTSHFTFHLIEWLKHISFYMYLFCQPTVCILSSPWMLDALAHSRPNITGMPDIYLLQWANGFHYDVCGIACYAFLAYLTPANFRAAFTNSGIVWVKAASKMISKLKPNISEDATQQYKQNNDNDQQKVAKNINLHNTPTICFQKLDGGVCPKVAE